MSTNGRPVRSKTYTEKGRAFELAKQQYARSDLEVRIRNKISELELLILQDSDQVNIREQYGVMNYLFDEYLKVHAKCQMLIDTDAERQSDDYSTDSLDRKVLNVKQQINTLLSSGNYGYNADSEKVISEEQAINRLSNSDNYGYNTNSEKVNSVKQETTTVLNSGNYGYNVESEKVISEDLTVNKSLNSGSYIPDFGMVSKEINSQHSDFERKEIRGVSKSRHSSKKSSSKSSKGSTMTSSKSSNKSTRSVRSQMAFEKAKLAELQVEAKFLKKKQTLEEESKTLNLHMEMAKTEAKIKAYEDSCSAVEESGEEVVEGPPPVLGLQEDKAGFVQHYVSQLEQPILNFVANELQVEPKAAFQNEVPVIDENQSAERPDVLYQKEVPVYPENKFYPVVESFVKKEIPTLKKETPVMTETVFRNNDISRLLSHMQAPEVDIDVFSGKVIDYKFFMATFAEVVENKIDDERGRLTRLLKYLDGEPKDLVKGCIYLPKEECYKEARKILDQQYGDFYRVLSEYRKELRAWPKIKSHDASAFRKFYAFLMKFKATVASVDGFHSHDSPDLIQVLQLKLPFNLQERWNRLSYDIRSKRRQQAGMKDFIEFIGKETLIVNDPNYSKEALGEIKESSQQTVHSHSGSTKTGVKSMLTSTNKVKCPRCTKPHDLDKCADYLSLPVVERRQFLFKKRLCFCCYEATTKDHSAKTCNKRRKCEVCKGPHPTGLHGYQPPVEKKEEDHPKSIDSQKVQPNATKVNDSPAVKPDSRKITSGCTKLTSEVISLSVVPVKVSHPLSSVEIFTNAILDNGSQGTFIQANLLDQLQVPTVPASISIKTMTGEETVKCCMVENLQVCSVFGGDQVKVKLPKTYSRSELPVDKEEVPTPDKVKCWKYLDEIQKYLPTDNDLEIGVLIGGNCPRALEPVEMIPSQGDGPYAYRSLLGWCVTGPIFTDCPSRRKHCNFVAVERNGGKPVQFSIQDEFKDITVAEYMIDMFNQDFSENQISPIPTAEKVSQEDFKFVKLMEDKVDFKDGHYYLPLPLRDPDATLPNNRIQAVQRATSLKKKLQKNPKMHSDYIAFMQSLLDKGYARKVTSKSSSEGNVWYIPHHGVYHPRKPDKIRIVFDCSAKYKDISLNSLLLQGPDLTNQIVGVLTRFREENIPIVADIESMFYQVRVPEDQRDMLRFVWWQDGDTSKELEDYQMCVHLFGGTHSPSTANFTLRKTAADNEDQYGTEAAETLRHNFYVDDMLKSTFSPQDAIDLLVKVKQMCASGGFNLTKFISSSREVLDAISDSDKAKGIKDIDLTNQSLPIERALGVSWCVENDMFNFRITLKDTPLTRRGILSSISSVYDPLGFAAPFLLNGKRLLQQLCSEGKNWDDEVSQEQRRLWEKWRRSLPLLEKINIPRCFKPLDFGEVSEASFHHFSDASKIGYGQVSYLRLVDSNGKINCSFLIGKARVAPLKPITVPRLELTAATTAAKVANQLRKEVTIKISYEMFWHDSKVVLGYIKNQVKKFHLFVANRIHQIHQFTNADQWNHVSTELNPADIATRGQDAGKLINNNNWFYGPSFLWKDLPDNIPQIFTVNDDDPEVKNDKNMQIHTITTDVPDLLDALTLRISSWYRLKRVVATMLMWRYKNRKIDVDLMQKAEVAIIKIVQSKAFSTELAILESSQDSKSLKKGSQLYRLNPFLDEQGLIRVGGRLSKSDLSINLKHPVILPKRDIVTEMVIRWCHGNVKHCGRGSTLNEVRQRGFHIINGNSRVRHAIFRCVTCRKYRGKVGEQQMADLPSDRVEESPPFTYAAVDMFGPFWIKEKRKEMKRYCALFTCMCSRAVHLESTNFIDTDSFIMALRRFISRRGEVRHLRSDNGTNFVGADAELKRAISEMDQEKIKEYLLINGADWMEWKFNPPAASHMGGIWERQIRSARSILTSLLDTHGTSLNDESFRTLLTEVEAVINSRPLTVENLSDADSLAPLTPNNLLTMKSKVILSPPGEFPKEDVYSRRRWRRIQHVANEFWCRWKKEYLQSLQPRRKWNTIKRNFCINDVVLLKVETPRNIWPMARILHVKEDPDGIVRSVTLKTCTNQVLDRPISKIVLLLESEE